MTIKKKTATTKKVQMEKKLSAEADKLGLVGKAKSGYVYGVLRRLFPVMRAKKKLVARQANPAPKKKAVARKKPRVKNPVEPANRQTQIEHAMALFKRFRLDDPQHIDDVAFTTPTVGMVIGDCDGILYTTKRNGKVERYKHDFKKSARPLLVASWDGKQVLLVGGNYNFTQDGITDI